MQPQQYSIIVLISGRGSNLKALISQARHYKIQAVLSNNPAAAGLEHAKNAGISTLAFSRAEGEKLSHFKARIRDEICNLTPKLVVLAGYMQIVEPELIESMQGRVINIHPSLLPAYPGLHTHERVLADGATRHGCTVHFVDKGVDTGPIIAQAAVDVLPTDNPDTLAERVLACEHRIYPWVINRIAQGSIKLEGGTVSIEASARFEATQLGFILPALQD
ncbi:MAG: phosphoribosylglycinamide formyltransferase [Oligoflexia bacterium]|nr:phosphoribosylglycinamide formyltransferase [Oligoflexia bacterium]